MKWNLNNKITDIMKTRFFALAMLALALAACNNDNENLNG
ncbi:fimbrillin family protein, partial [Bacteroides thetaiotaomicron]